MFVDNSWELFGRWDSIFADSNADGALTGDEYKTWLASNGKGQAKSDTQR